MHLWNQGYRCEIFLTCGCNLQEPLLCFLRKYVGSLWSVAVSQYCQEKVLETFSSHVCVSVHVCILIYSLQDISLNHSFSCYWHLRATLCFGYELPYVCKNICKYFRPFHILLSILRWDKILAWHNLICLLLAFLPALAWYYSTSSPSRRHEYFPLAFL